MSERPSPELRIQGLRDQRSIWVKSWDSLDLVGASDCIGRFIINCLEGRHRGNIGREEIPLASRLWIIVRDHSGLIYTPVKVVRSWASCKLLVKPRGVDLGDSICGCSQREKPVVSSTPRSWSGFKSLNNELVPPGPVAS